MSTRPEGWGAQSEGAELGPWAGHGRSGRPWTVGRSAGTAWGRPVERTGCGWRQEGGWVSVAGDRVKIRHSQGHPRRPSGHGRPIE